MHVFCIWLQATSISSALAIFIEKKALQIVWLCKVTHGVIFLTYLASYSVLKRLSDWLSVMMMTMLGALGRSPFGTVNE